MDHDFWNPEKAGLHNSTTRHNYSKEDCGHNDLSLSPISHSGREAMTLTPAPNRAKVFYIAFLNIAAEIEHRALDARPLRLSSQSMKRHRSVVSFQLVSRQSLLRKEMQLQWVDMRCTTLSFKWLLYL